MEWSRRIKLTKIRRLYRSIHLGIYDDEALKEVGSELCARCADIVAVAGAFRNGLVPCPQCGAKVQRQINVSYYGSQSFSSGDQGQVEQADFLEEGHIYSWLHCPHCTKRLIWGDFRKALRESPRCFNCCSLLEGTDELRCNCGKVWTARAYRRSANTRICLPCPHCNTIVRKPTSPATSQEVWIFPEEFESQSSRQTFQCPKCEGIVLHIGAHIQCIRCGWNRRWRDYKKELKRRDEQLKCSACNHAFGWQAWRKGVKFLTIDNPYPAQDFVNRWSQCRTPQERMMLIDLLLQTLHSQGPLAPMFIEGDEQSIRRLLDELAEVIDMLPR